MQRVDVVTGRATPLLGSGQWASARRRAASPVHVATVADFRRYVYTADDRGDISACGWAKTWMRQHAWPATCVAPEASFGGLVDATGERRSSAQQFAPRNWRIGVTGAQEYRTQDQERRNAGQERSRVRRSPTPIMRGPTTGRLTTGTSSMRHCARAVGARDRRGRDGPGARTHANRGPRPSTSGGRCGRLAATSSCTSVATGPATCGSQRCPRHRELQKCRIAAIPRAAPVRRRSWERP